MSSTLWSDAGFHLLSPLVNVTSTLAALPVASLVSCFYLFICFYCFYFIAFILCSAMVAVKGEAITILELRFLDILYYHHNVRPVMYFRSSCLIIGINPTGDF